MLEEILAPATTGQVAGIGGCVALFDASDLGSLSISAGVVNSWASKFGNAVAVASGTARPAWSATARNGTPGVSFDGVDDLMALKNIDLWPRFDRPCTMIVAGSVDVTAAASGFAFSYGSGSQRAVRTGGTTPSLRGSLGLGASSATIPGTSLWSGTDRVISAVFPIGRGVKTVYDAQGLSTVSSVLNLGTNADQGNLGADIAGANFLKFTAQAILMFNRDLSDGERQRIEGWAAWRYDPTNRAALGASHPFKSVTP